MSKWSSNKDSQLIFESWRKYLSEEPGPEPEPEQKPAMSAKGARIFIQGHDLGLEDFVAQLKKIAADPGFRKLALAGHDDDQGPSDEALTVSEGKPVAAKNLTPTQKDIDLDKSLGDQMTNKWTPPATEAALQPTNIMLPSPGGPIPVLTYGNKYILDGHHRWSQVMMTNPDGAMAVNNLAGASLGSAEAALKATQLAIAALAGKVTTKGTKTNLLAVNEEHIKKYVIKNIQPVVLELLVKYKKIAKPDRALAAEYYAANLAAIQSKPPGKFDREKGMPQADDSGIAQAKVNTVLAKGLVNFDDPKLSDLKPKK